MPATAHRTLSAPRTTSSIPTANQSRIHQSGKAHPALLVVSSVALTLLATWLWGRMDSKPNAAPTQAAAPGAGNAMPPGPPGAGGPAAGGSRRFGGGNRAQPVTVGTVEQRDMRVLINAVGSMSAQNTAIVRAKVDGEVKALHFKEGQLVKAGQLLAELDGRAYEAQLAQAQGQLMRDQAQLRNAQLDLQRYKDLLAKDAIARQQVETQDALVKQLEGSVKADQGAVDNARLSLSYTKVTAPIAGVASLKQVDLGTVARSSDANGIVTLAQTQPMALVFAIPEAQAQRVLRQMKGKGGLTVQAWDRDMKRPLASGQVVSTDNAIDAATGTLKVKAQFANKDNTLLPNQFVNVQLQVDTLKGVLAVPDASIQRGPQGTFVYVVQPDGTVNMRRIKLGTQEGDLWSVEGELKPGEKVVTDGADRLREGAKVETITPAPRGPGGFGGGNGRAGRADGAGKPAGAASAANASAGDAGADKTQRKSEGTSGKPADAGKGPPVSMSANAPANTAPAAPVANANAGAGDFPPWFDRLPHEVQDKLRKMSPAERAQALQEMRERREKSRQQREANGG